MQQNNSEFFYPIMKFIKKELFHECCYTVRSDTGSINSLTAVLIIQTKSITTIPIPNPTETCKTHRVTMSCVVCCVCIGVLLACVMLSCVIWLSVHSPGDMISRHSVTWTAGIEKSSIMNWSQIQSPQTTRGSGWKRIWKAVLWPQPNCQFPNHSRSAWSSCRGIWFDRGKKKD